MAVLLPGKFIYLATPHTASISTRNALLKLKGAHVSQNFHHSTVADWKLREPDIFLGGEITVTTIRNPYDLLVTWWLRQRKNLIKKWGYEPKFREYIRIVNDETPGGPYIRNGRIFWMEADTHFRYESLQRDLDRFLKRYGFPAVELTWENETPNKHPWGVYYDEETRAIAERRFGAEAALYGYRFP